MMWFTADLHLGDTNILHDMDRPFDSVEEMNRKVIDAINECVAADDRLYILGDFTYRLPMAEAVRLCELAISRNIADKKDEGFEARRDKLEQKLERQRRKEERQRKLFEGETLNQK